MFEISAEKAEIIPAEKEPEKKPLDLKPTGYTPPRATPFILDDFRGADAYTKPV
jgi:hypothetical protein